MSKQILAALALSALMSANIAAAAPSGPAWTFTAPAQSFNNNDWNFTNNFKVLNSVTVSGLGYYADPQTQAVDNNPVSLFACDTPGCATTGTLLASVIVDNTYPITNLFRFVTIAPLVLAPGDYQIAGISRGDNYTWNNPGFATHPDIQYAGNSWLLTSSAPAPFFLDFLRNDVTDGYWGPNLFIGQPTFTGVPTPAALGVFGLALLGLAATRRRA